MALDYTENEPNKWALVSPDTICTKQISATSSADDGRIVTVGDDHIARGMPRPDVGYYIASRWPRERALVRRVLAREAAEASEAGGSGEVEPGGPGTNLVAIGYTDSGNPKLIDFVHGIQ